MSAHSKISYSLGHARKLAKPALFREAYEQRNRHNGKFMTLWVRDGAGASLRLGVVASKRTERLAVRRNKAKRKLREVFRLNRPGLTGNVDVVLTVRGMTADACSTDLNNEFLRLAERAGLIAHDERM